MALPVLKSLEDCGDFSKTVEPFIPQLYALPGQLRDAITSPEQLKLVYLTTNPLISGFAASLVFGAIFLVVSEANRNYSQVDRMWSILPNLYVCHLAVWARLAGLNHSRIDLIAVFTTIWSARLTFNYWRRGGYQVGSEDYRWAIAKSYVPEFVWSIFNLLFIAFYQSILIFAFSCVPAYAILLTTQFEPTITTADQFYFLIEVGLVVSEWVSDGQQWDYQNAKHQYNKDAKVPKQYTQAQLDRGFNTTGVWAYSRHPNFLAEQTIWLVLYQWSCYATNNLYNWTLVGSGALIMLFQASTWLTELITAGKYTEYSDYQKQVGMFIPKSVKPYSAPARKTSDVSKGQQHGKKQK